MLVHPTLREQEQEAAQVQAQAQVEVRQEFDQSRD